MVNENPQWQHGEPDEGRQTASASEPPDPVPDRQAESQAPGNAGLGEAGETMSTSAQTSTGPEPRGTPKSGIVYCVRCGATMSPGDLFCHSCGWNAEKPLPAIRVAVNPSDRNRLATLLLCLLLGWLGAHRFYVGKIGTGILWLCTLGFLGIGVIYDLVLIATGEFRDDQRRRVVHWE